MSLLVEDALKLHARAEIERHLPASDPSDSDCYTEGIYCHIHQQSPTYDVTQMKAEWLLSS